MLDLLDQTLARTSCLGVILWGRLVAFPSKIISYSLGKSHGSTLCMTSWQVARRNQAKLIAAAQGPVFCLLSRAIAACTTCFWHRCGDVPFLTLSSGQKTTICKCKAAFHCNISIGHILRLVSPPPQENHWRLTSNKMFAHSLPLQDWALENHFCSCDKTSSSTTSFETAWYSLDVV
jgi:hypothetical protein